MEVYDIAEKEEIILRNVTKERMSLLMSLLAYLKMGHS